MPATLVLFLTVSASIVLGVLLGATILALSLRLLERVVGAARPAGARRGSRPAG